MFKITIITDLSNLRHLEDKIKKPNPLFDGYDKIMRTSTYQKFDDRQGVWKPSISAQREGRYTLVKSGDLRDSVTKVNDSHHIKNMNGYEFDFGTNIPYAYEHNFGIGQEKRTFLDITENDLNLLSQETLKYLIGDNY